VPIKVAIGVGALLLVVAFARYIIPALVAGVGLGVLIAILFVPYWLPTIIAFFRGHQNKLPIFAINLFLGWTFVGWWVALFMAITNPSAGNQTVVVNVASNTSVGAGMPPQGAVNNYNPAVPAHQPTPPAVASGPTQYRVGEIVNGYQFDGSNWLPVGTPQGQPAPPPPLER
jgi:hypothetical protein